MKSARPMSNLARRRRRREACLRPRPAASFRSRTCPCPSIPSRSCRVSMWPLKAQQGAFAHLRSSRVVPALPSLVRPSALSWGKLCQGAALVRIRSEDLCPMILVKRRALRTPLAMPHAMLHAPYRAPRRRRGCCKTLRDPSRKEVAWRDLQCARSSRHPMSLMWDLFSSHGGRCVSCGVRAARCALMRSDRCRTTDIYVCARVYVYTRVSKCLAVLVASKP